MGSRAAAGAMLSALPRVFLQLPLPAAARVVPLSISPKVILCSSPKIPSLLDFYGPDVVPLRDRLTPQHHGDPSLPSDRFYYEVVEDGEVSGF